MKTAKTKKKTKTRVPTGAVRLSRADYAVTRAAAVAKKEPLLLEIVAPIQVCVTMEVSYAELLLKVMHADDHRMKWGESCSILIDCPVEIVMNAKTRKNLIAALEKVTP